MTIVYELIMIITPIVMLIIGVKFGRRYRRKKIGDDNVCIGDVYTSKIDMNKTVIIMNIGKDPDGNVYVEYAFSANGIYSYRRRLDNFKNDYIKITWKEKK